VPDHAQLANAMSVSHRWALRRARAAFHVGLAGRDKSLPGLSERRILQLSGGDGPLEGRLYTPVGVSVGAPLLLYFHGGGFVVSDLDTHEALCIRLAAAGQMRVLSASYRLAPEHRFPAQLDDAIAVTRWVLEVSGLVAAEGLVLGGDSAGAYLAASAAARMQEERRGAITAQLLLYPLLQLDDAVWTSSLLRQTRLIGWAAVRYIKAQILSAGVAAPSLLDRSANLPTVIATGGVLDPVRDDAIVLADQLRSAGVRVIWREYPRLIHGFGNLTHVSEAMRQAVAEVGALIGEMARGAMPHPGN
jgi:acetyl esterase